MYQFLVDKTTAWLAPAKGYAVGSDEYKKLQYGTYVFYLNFLKTAVLLILAFALGIARYILVFALAYGALRLNSFGIHLNHPLTCTLLGLVYYIGGAYFSIYVPVPLAVKIPVFALCFAAFCWYAPAETKRRPIPASKRGTHKIKSLAALAAVTALSCALSAYGGMAYSTVLLVATVCQTVNILPVAYKLVKEV